MQLSTHPPTTHVCNHHRTLTPRPVHQQRLRHAVVCPALATPPSSGGLDYKAAGVDIDAGNELVNRIKKLNPDIGGFGGLVPYGDNFLVAGTDGVGTKLKLAFEMNKHDTIGIDLVAMSVNDVITLGAKPLFFLDYFACGKLDVDQAENVIKGIVEGCNQSDCVLLGGETAEMPGMYTGGEYDLAGFAVGSVGKDRVINGKRIAQGDVLLGFASSGVHSNGFSLVRKVLEVSGTSLDSPVPWGAGSFGEVLLAPTVIYVRAMLKLIDTVDVKGLCHITGGGFPENLPRIFPKGSGLGCTIDKASWTPPPIFQWVQEAGGVSESEMFRTFNMGIGMVAVVPKEQVDAALGAGLGAFVIGSVTEGEGVRLE